MSAAAPALSMETLCAFDPHASAQGSERRYLCPLCGDGKPKDAAHRCLCANVETGAWNCKRCKATGKLTDFWQERPKLNPRALARQRRAQISSFSSSQSTPEFDRTSGVENNVWRQHLRGLISLQGTAGESYLQHRGIAPETAHAAGARYSGGFYGRAAVVFPIRDRAGGLVAASGRYVDGRDNPKTRIAGPKRDGVFMAPVPLQSGSTLQPFDESAPAIIVTEAPIDALSLATAGYPAIALCGTTGPAWLYLACGLRRVLLAFDGDAAGDKAADGLSGALAAYGASCERLRPEGGKDWNEALCTSGAAKLAEWLAARVLLDTAARTTIEGTNDDSIFDD
jgi:hypothetical protein